MPSAITNALAFLLVLAAVGSVAVALRVRRGDNGGRWLAVVMVGAAWVGVLTAAGFYAGSAERLLLARKVRYAGYAVIPPAWFLFAARFTDADRLAGRRAVAALAGFVALTLAVVATTHVHGLFYTGEASYRLVDGVPDLSATRGAYFDLYIGVTYVLIAVGTALLLLQAVRTRRAFRRQALTLAVAALVPWTANAASLVWPTAFPFDPTPVALPVSGALIATSLRRHRLFDTAPVARDIVVDRLDDGVLVLDGDDRVLDFNPVMEALLVAGTEVGDPLADAAPPGVVRAIGDATGDGGANGDATDNGGTDDSDDGDASSDRGVTLAVGGDRRTYDVRVTPLSGRVAGAGRVALFRDVTLRERRERELAARNERLDRFAGVVSHDLRNPLNVAEGYRELAAADRDSPYLDRVADAHERMETIIDDLLLLARGDAVEPRSVRLSTLAREAWETVDTLEATLSVESDRRLRADPTRTRRLFENLFRNAVEHGGDGVRVEVGATDDGFAVADDGPGVDPADADDLFEAGRSGAGSTGLGLAIVRTVAEDHGWSVGLDRDAAGARFVVSGVADAADAPVDADTDADDRVGRGDRPGTGRDSDRDPPGSRND
ncbi:sensor histidine kinase [Candidatus Halobonum tyrrellensis]|uniref:histidine kinase n=1 Tax=Candidatus Halobonum tyrrellensis G22 TaxID=1324957 RepID=V4IZI9_9EURY|nr:histidine kinase N-terminal 7TM domain-containing protein [Candidatus Halobonum tyrrellensis]ESP88552.1 HTR-like protein [Candidatus Halobonum tyrrellensis G22]